MIIEYSCQQCGRTFKSENEQEIIRHLTPTCSNLCMFRAVYNYVNKLPITEKDLKLILEKQKRYRKDTEMSRAKMVYSYTQWFVTHKTVSSRIPTVSIPMVSSSLIVREDTTIPKRYHDTKLVYLNEIPQAAKTAIILYEGKIKEKNGGK